MHLACLVRYNKLIILSLCQKRHWKIVIILWCRELLTLVRILSLLFILFLRKQENSKWTEQPYNKTASLHCIMHAIFNVAGRLLNQSFRFLLRVMWIRLSWYWYLQSESESNSWPLLTLRRYHQGLAYESVAWQCSDHSVQGAGISHT